MKNRTDNQFYDTLHSLTEPFSIGQPDLLPGQKTDEKTIPAKTLVAIMQHIIDGCLNKYSPSSIETQREKKQTTEIR